MDEPKKFQLSNITPVGGTLSYDPNNLPDDPVVLKQLVGALHGALTKERELGTTDIVTELPNRRGIEQSHTLIHRAGKYGLLILDLDGFKEANDTYGHEVGDKVLKHNGQIMRSSLQRASDIVGRPGGDEFTLILPGLEDPITLAIVGERIRKNIEANPFLLNGVTPIRVTASIGGAISYKLPHELPERIAHQADAAMYLSKNAGKNGVSIYDNGKFFRHTDGNLIKVEEDAKIADILNYLQLPLAPGAHVVPQKPPENTKT